jgi:hypothetical protein
VAGGSPVQGQPELYNETLPQKKKKEKKRKGNKEKENERSQLIGMRK